MNPDRAVIITEAWHAFQSPSLNTYFPSRYDTFVAGFEAALKLAETQDEEQLTRLLNANRALVKSIAEGNQELIEALAKDDDELVEALAEDDRELVDALAEEREHMEQSKAAIAVQAATIEALHNEVRLKVDAIRELIHDRDSQAATIESVKARLQEPVHPYGDETIPRVPEIQFARDAYGEGLFDDLEAILEGK